jgi:hypothetical protein
MRGKRKIRRIGTMGSGDLISAAVSLFAGMLLDDLRKYGTVEVIPAEEQQENIETVEVEILSSKIKDK